MKNLLNFIKSLRSGENVDIWIMLILVLLFGEMMAIGGLLYTLYQAQRGGSTEYKSLVRIIIICLGLVIH